MRNCNSTASRLSLLPMVSSDAANEGVIDLRVYGEAEGVRALGNGKFAVSAGSRRQRGHGEWRRVGGTTGNAMLYKRLDRGRISFRRRWCPRVGHAMRTTGY